MVIVEGPDGSGKSTLVRRLMGDFPDLRLGARGTINRDLLWTVTKEDTLRALGHAVRGDQKPFIWDRLYFSDFVYAPLGMPPREGAFNEATENHVRAVLKALWCPVILCLPPRSVVLDNVASERYQMEGVRERAGEIYDAYKNMRWPIPVLLYDYTEPAYYQTVVDFIDDYLLRRKERAA